MAYSKKEHFTRDEIKFAEAAKALSHPARVQILKILLKKQSCICGEIVDLLPLSQSTVSQHLAELKKIGLVEGDINGTKICYCINMPAFKKIQNLFNSLLLTCHKIAK